MHILTVDFETFYDPKYSLSKITTEEYIRHRQFEVIGVSVKVDDGEPEWFSGTMAQTGKWLAQFPWDDCIAVAHNAMFDMAILNWHFDIRPKRIADTLSMARALDGPDAGNSLAKLAERHGAGIKGTEVINALGKRRLDFTKEDLARYGEYCINDVELTYKLFTQMAKGFPVSELRLIDLTIRMFTEPVLELDRDTLEKHLLSVREKKDKLLSKAVISKENLMSNPQLAATLESLGVDVPMKISPTTGKETYAFSKTDEEFLALLDHEKWIVQAIVAARLGVKSTLEETRTERFLGVASRGALPVPLRYYAAHTGRFGGDDKVNMQNLPRSSPLKYAILAPVGHLIIDCDSSQIEARTLAWLAGQVDLVEAFDRGEDVYKIMASAIYGVPEDQIDKDMRFVGKTTILGCLAEGTPVLTDRGWVAIEDVRISDRLWDGGEWVCHQGLVQKGTKETLSLCGLWLTPDHKVLCGTQWLEAQSVAQDAGTLSLALDTGAVSWLSPGTYVANAAESLPSLHAATVGVQNILLTDTTSKISGVPDVPRAANGRGIEKDIGGIFQHSPILPTGNVCLTDSTQLFLDVTIPMQDHTPTTEVEAYSCASSGGKISQRFSGTHKLYPDGTIPSSTWTGLTTAVGTNPVTYGLYPEQITTQTEEKSASFRRSLMTYDIAYAGARNRYTVATDAGPIIVHNCGYGMGAKKFQSQLKNFKVDMPLEECQRIIEVYRETYPAIPALWAQAGRALNAMINNQTAPLGRDGVLMVEGEAGIVLPNKLRIRYPNLRATERDGKRELVYDTKKGKAVIPNRIYGGKVIENLCQALARIVVSDQMLMISRRYKVAMTVHDSVVPVVPEAQAEEAQTFVEQCMRTRPKWATGLPLNCESKIGASYGG